MAEIILCSIFDDDDDGRTVETITIAAAAAAFGNAQLCLCSLSLLPSLPPYQPCCPRSWSVGRSFGSRRRRRRSCCRATHLLERLRCKFAPINEKVRPTSVRSFMDLFCPTDCSFPLCRVPIWQSRLQSDQSQFRANSLLTNLNFEEGLGVHLGPSLPPSPSSPSNTSVVGGGVVMMALLRLLRWRLPQK